MRTLFILFSSNIDHYDGSDGSDEVILIIFQRKNHFYPTSFVRSQLVRGFLLSGMCFIHSKPIRLVGFFILRNSYLKFTRYEIFISKGEGCYEVWVWEINSFGIIFISIYTILLM